jgi:hypothetical protein
MSKSDLEFISDIDKIDAEIIKIFESSKKDKSKVINDLRRERDKKEDEGKKNLRLNNIKLLCENSKQIYVGTQKEQYPPINLLKGFNYLNVFPYSDVSVSSSLCETFNTIENVRGDNDVIVGALFQYMIDSVIGGNVDGQSFIFRAFA